MATSLNDRNASMKMGNEDISIVDDSADDFEVVSNTMLDGKFSIVSEYRSRGDSRTDTKDDRTQQESMPMIDPLAAFEMIHSEHRLLKDELESQNELLRQRLDAMEQQERRKAEEIEILKNELATLSLELGESKTHQLEMERQIKYFKESSEKADLLTAKLLEAEDLMKSQHEMIQQLKSDGYSGTPLSPCPVPSTDEGLRAEISQKAEEINRLESTLASLESALGAMNGERLKAKEETQNLAEMNRELQTVISDLQLQAEADKVKSDLEKAEWNALRTDLEQQIQILSDRVIAFENQYSGQSMTETMTNTATGEQTQGPIPTIHHRDTSSSSGSQAQWVMCERCHLPRATQGSHPCPAVIDDLF